MHSYILYIYYRLKHRRNLEMSVCSTTPWEHERPEKDKERTETEAGKKKDKEEDERNEGSATKGTDDLSLLKWRLCSAAPSRMNDLKPGM